MVCFGVYAYRSFGGLERDVMCCCAHSFDRIISAGGDGSAENPGAHVGGLGIDRRTAAGSELLAIAFKKYVVFLALDALKICRRCYMPDRRGLPNQMQFVLTQAATHDQYVFWIKIWVRGNSLPYASVQAVAGFAHESIENHWGFQCNDFINNMFYL